ncbi:MAG: beta-ketoacyl-ACP synthase III, partial [Candidatus Krumholzibacteriia bacterium]
MSSRTLLTAGITGVGMDFPERRLTNADLEKMVETSESWITERTGIRERRIVEPGTGASHHGVGAARKALAHAGLTPADVDLIIVPTVTPDMMFPATACIIQEQLGATQAWGFDVSAACSGFVFALQAARAQIETGASRCALVIGTEVMSSIVDYRDRNVCVLFGDGAGAVVVQPVPAATGGIVDSMYFIDGSGGRYLNMPGGGSLNPPTHATVDADLHFIHQEGREVFKYAVKGMAAITTAVLERNGVSPADVALFVPHQANLRIIESVRERLGLTPEQVMITIDRFGNTTSASIPSALRVACDEGRLK